MTKDPQQQPPPAPPPTERPAQPSNVQQPSRPVPRVIQYPTTHIQESKHPNPQPCDERDLRE